MTSPETVLRDNDTTSCTDLYLSFELGDKRWTLTLSDARRGPSPGSNAPYTPTSDQDAINLPRSRFMRRTGQSTMKTETTAQPRLDNIVLIEADVPMCAYLWQWRLQISDERAIREVHTIWIDAVKAGDLVRLLTLMADGGAHTLSPAAS